MAWVRWTKCSRASWRRSRRGIRSGDRGLGACRAGDRSRAALLPLAEKGSRCRVGSALPGRVAIVEGCSVLKIHILGIAGTFMGGVAALARELGHEVEGSDQAVYPPMSTQLESLGIRLEPGYLPGNISPDVDRVVVGNALSRGNAAVEHVLDAGPDYTSGAQWLLENVLPGRDTLAVAGTHGKTTTTTILAYLLQAGGREPGFLIGGVAEDFGVSARIGAGREFVVEADEYDTAFF